MTHELLSALTGLSIDLIIIDEDPDKSLVKNTYIELSSLSAICGSGCVDEKTARGLLEFVLSVQQLKREDGLDIDLSFLRNEVAPCDKNNAVDNFQRE